MTATCKYQRWTPARWTLVFLAVIGLTLGALGCAEKITGPEPAATVSVNLELKAGPAVSFRLTISAADIDTIRIPMAATAGELVTVVEVPFGSARHFVVEGLDLDGVVLYRGETVQDVLAIQALDLTIEMPPVAPMIYLIPHFTTVRVGSEFVITVCVNNLPGLTNAGFGLSLNGQLGSNKLFDPIVIESVELDPGQVELGTVLSVSQEGATDVFISMFLEVGTLVDVEGDGCLVNIHCRTQDTWEGEPFDLFPTMFLENLNGIALTLDEVHLDTARFRLFRDQEPESFLGTEGDDTGVAMVPLAGGETMLAGTTIVFDPQTEGQENFLYLASLDRGLQPQFERLLPWNSLAATFGLARSTAGFYAVGTGGQAGGEIFHVDNGGNEIWRETLGPLRQFFDVAARPGGGCIVAGSRQNDGSHFYLASFEPDGSSVAFEPTDFSADDTYRAVAAVNDSTFIAVGTKRAFSGPDFNIVVGKYTFGQAFKPVFERLTVSKGDRVPLDVVLTDDGGFVAVGFANAASGSQNDILAIRYDADGFPVWERTFAAQGEEFGVAVTAADDGGFVIAGTTAVFVRGTHDVVVTKVSAEGDLVWQRVHGGPDDEQARDIIRDGSGYLITGASNVGPSGGQDILMLRVDSEGQ